MSRRSLSIGVAVLLALAAGLAGLAAVLGLAAPGSVPARAAGALGAVGRLQSRGIRRESVPPSAGRPPLTGPAAPFQPLIIPGFGDNVRANTDTQSPNLAQQEPSIAVNPTNPLDVVAAAKDERAGANTKQVWIYTSTDGGVTWLNQQFPLIAPASPYSSDPVVTFSDDGQAYVTALPYGGGANDGIQVARSTDGGITFSTGVHLPGSNNGSDKEWTWVDNFPGSLYYHRIYVAWMNFNAGNVIAFNYSSDRGVTWSPLVSVGNAAQFPMPVVLPNGDVLVSEYTLANQVGFRRSTNGGQSFGLLQSVAPIVDPNCPPDNSGCGIWRLNAIPANSVDPRNGDEVITWADGSTGTGIILYSRSTDNGATWSAAAQLAPPGVANTYQVEPWVVADEQGTFHAIWYDDRDHPNTSIFHIFYSQSTDEGATWSTAQRISTATTDLRVGIPPSYALAAGDYINMTAAAGNVYAAWTDTRAGNGEDIYTVRGVIPPGTPTATPIGGPPTATATLPPTATRTQTTVPSATATPPAATATQTAASATPAAPSATSTTAPSATETVAVTSTALPATDTPAPSSTPAAATATPVPPSPTVAPCTVSFSDVPPSAPFYLYIHYLACNGVVSGYADGTFRPFNPATRAQMVKIVVLGFHRPLTTPAAGGHTFADVPVGAPFFDVIETAAAANIVSGYPCGGPGEPCDSANRPYFRPNVWVTRGQFTKITVVGKGWSLINPATPSFADVVPGSAFYEFVETAYCHGLISGYTCGGPGEPCDSQQRPYFRPGATGTRAQLSKVVYLAVQSTADCVAPTVTR